MHYKDFQLFSDIWVVIIESFLHLKYLLSLQIFARIIDLSYYYIVFHYFK